MDTDSPDRAAPVAARYARLSIPQQGLVFLFIAAAVWYLSWRASNLNPDAPVFSTLVYAAELFGFACAVLFIYVCWSLRQPVPLPVPAEARAAVFVPTINESVDIVRRTLLSAQRMKHADEVWLLDDGNRPEMRLLAGELGCRYLARTGIPTPRRATSTTRSSTPRRR